jgi:hypothetical protein
LLAGRLFVDSEQVGRVVCVLARRLSYRDGTMIGTLQALLVALLAVLPGALFTIAQETHGASWAWRQTDPSGLLVRFLTFSAVFHALFAPLTYYAYRRLILNPVLANGWSISWRWYALLLAYMATPYFLGVLTEKGRDVKGLRWLVSLWGGRYPELRAWDRFFRNRPGGLLRLKLTDDGWKLGLFNNKGSYASGYGEDGDIYLVQQYLIDPDTGVPAVTDKGDLIEVGAGLLIRWSEVKYFDFFPWEPKS